MITPETYQALGLSDEEYNKILDIMGREPTPTELAMFSVEWSEHCGYMCSKSHISNFPKKGKYTSKIGEDSGAIIVDDLAIVFKIESHNHPSQVEPFQGSATCVGGIIRDIFTAGARPIASLDSLRFGSLSDAYNKHLFKEVVRGIGWYGNCVGVPTVGGEVYFDDSYTGNCLVNGMTIGVCHKDNLMSAKAMGIGNSIMYVGHSTGRDGIGGCSVLASNEFKEDDTKRATVQVGDPFKEKCLIEATLEIIEQGYVVGIKDMGAAGLTCSLSEMAAAGNVGLYIDLEKIPLREEGMEPWEIMMSESQERMVVCVKEGKEEEVQKIFDKWELTAAVIGIVEDHGKIVIMNKSGCVANIPVQQLTNPNICDLPTEMLTSSYTNQWDYVPDEYDQHENLFKLIASPNIASRHSIFEQYDHMVQTNTVILPNQGDAAVIRIKGTDKAIAATTDCNSRYCHLSPYRGAYAAVLEAARNLLCVGAEPIGVTNCLNFGNPKKKERYHEFTESVRGISDACYEHRIPVVSGNVSFYNEDEKGAINPTPVIGMIGIIHDVNKTVTQYFKKPNNAIIMLGTKFSSTNSTYCEYLGVCHGIYEGTSAPPPMDTFHTGLHRTMLHIIGNGWVNSAHDCSEGGLLVALSECCITNPRGLLGARIILDETFGDRADYALFNETTPRIVISCDVNKVNPIIQTAINKQLDVSVIGWTNNLDNDPKLHVTYKNHEVIDADLIDLKHTWRHALTRSWK